MKILKVTLIILLVLVTGLYGVSTLMQQRSGADIGPTITCGTETLEISVGDDESVLFTGVTAVDEQDGDLTGQILIQGISKFITDSTARVTYLVFDSDGNMATTSRYIHYVDYTAPVFEITSPLVYSPSESIALLDRIRATDVIDGDITDSIRVSNLTATSDAEIYTVTLMVTNSMGDTVTVELPIILESNSASRPDVYLREYLVYLKAGSAFNASGYLRAVETPTGETAKLSDVQITGLVDTKTPGTYMVYYRYYQDAMVGTAVLTVVVE